MRLALFINGLERSQHDPLFIRLFDAHVAAKKEGTPLTILIGDAPSDRVIQAYCKENSIDVVVFKPFHVLDASVSFDPKFFFLRDRQIVENADLIYVAEPEKATTNYSAVKRIAQKKGIPLLEF